jgi:hypothetical protein
VKGICATFIFLLLMNSLAYARPLPPIRLSPQIQMEEVEVSPYPMDIIKPFLSDSLMVCHREELACSPKVIGLDHRRGDAGKGDYIYVRGLCDDGPCENDYLCEGKNKIYTIYRPGKNYYSPCIRNGCCDREYLGYEAEVVGTAELTKLGPVSELQVKDASEGVEIGFFVLPSTVLPPKRDFIARPATIKCEGYILHQRTDGVPGGAPDIGRNDVVVLSLGQRDGLTEGDMLDVWQANLPRTVCEPCPCPPKLPDRRAGRIVVFRIYEKLSLGLVVEAEEIIRLMDRVRAPI